MTDFDPDKTSYMELFPNSSCWPAQLGGDIQPLDDNHVLISHKMVDEEIRGIRPLETVLMADLEGGKTAALVPWQETGRYSNTARAIEDILQKRAGLCLECPLFNKGCRGLSSNKSGGKGRAGDPAIYVHMPKITADN